MAKKKPIWAVQFAGGMSGIACQTVKAIDREEAVNKFLKANPSKNEEDHIIDVDLLDEDHKHYRILANGAI